MKVKSLMSPEVVTVTDEATLADAARLMWERASGFVAVTAAGDERIVGVVTDRDICMGALTTGAPLHRVPVTQSMTSKVVSCGPDQTLASAHRTMREHRIRRLPVIDGDDRILGLICLDGLAMHATQDRGTQAVTRQREVARTLSAIAESVEVAEEASAAAEA